MADDLAYLLQALGIQKAHIMGASMGGAVAQEFAAKYPERTGRLILLCTYMKADAFVRQLATFWMQAVEKTGHVLLCEGILPWLYTREFFEDQQLALDWARKLIQEQEPFYSIRGFQWRAQAALSADMTERVHLINAPALVVAGEQDLVVPPSLCRKLADAIKGARFAVIRGGGHAFFDEKPFELNEVLLDFLRAENS
jgi:pimeloyl-ACP methyl ester carboxylesterase